MGCRVRYKIWGGRARGRGVCGCRISGGYGLKEAMCIIFCAWMVLRGICIDFEANTVITLVPLQMCQLVGFTFVWRWSIWMDPGTELIRYN
jgi:hypothetical protein